MLFDLGMDFFPCLGHREEMPHCEVPVKIIHAGFRILLAFPPGLGVLLLFCRQKLEGSAPVPLLL